MNKSSVKIDILNIKLFFIYCLLEISLTKPTQIKPIQAKLSQSLRMWHLDDWNKYARKKKKDTEMKVFVSENNENNDNDEVCDVSFWVYFYRKSIKKVRFPEDSLLEEVQLDRGFKSKTHYDALTLVIEKTDGKTLLEKFPPKGILKRLPLNVCCSTFVRGVIGSTKV